MGYNTTPSIPCFDTMVYDGHKVQGIANGMIVYDSTLPIFPWNGQDA